MIYLLLIIPLVFLCSFISYLRNWVLPGGCHGARYEDWGRSWFGWWPVCPFCGRPLAQIKIIVRDPWDFILFKRGRQ